MYCNWHARSSFLVLQADQLAVARRSSWDHKAPLSNRLLAGREMLLLSWTMEPALLKTVDLCKFTTMLWYNYKKATGASTCSCSVDWGDRSNITIKELDVLGPCQMEHQYEKMDAEYMVTAMYCSAPDDPCLTKCCKSYVELIRTSPNPPGKTLWLQDI